MTNSAETDPRRQIAELLSEARRVLLISHVDPDGDTVGSALGLAWSLRARGIEARVACADPLPAELRFLPGAEEYTARGVTDEDLIITVDTSDPLRIGALLDEVTWGDRPVVNIDHHVTNVGFGHVNLVEPLASTAELVYALIRELELPLDVRVATCLLTGVVTDTRGFRTSNTTADALRTALALVEAGASLPHITDAVFNHLSTDTLRVWSAALPAARLEGGIAWVVVQRAQLRAAGISAGGSSGLVNFLISLDEAQIAILFTELEDGSLEVSLRSRPGIDVSGIAFSCGGGGHPQAAGCTIPGPAEVAREQVLQATRRALATLTEPVAGGQGSPARE